MSLSENKYYEYIFQLKVEFKYRKKKYVTHSYYNYVPRECACGVKKYIVVMKLQQGIDLLDGQQVAYQKLVEKKETTEYITSYPIYCYNSDLSDDISVDSFKILSFEHLDIPSLSMNPCEGSFNITVNKRDM